ncbi:MAG: FkbM family methyltransferase [Paracoccaceae bacterium]
MLAWSLRMYRFFRRHPLTEEAPARALRRALAWQVASRICPFDMLMPWTGGTRLVMRRGMTGATGNWYTGLHEYQDMGFILHLLRPDDLFFDVGANIGSYTVLAAGAAGAEVMSVEPGDDARAVLAANVRVNDLSGRVQISDEGVAATDGVAYFTSGLDTLNHLADGPGPGTVEIKVRSLDSLAEGRVPVAIKMDVEGGEFDALTGAAGLLGNPDLKALILELNDLVTASGHSKQEIYDLLAGHGFEPCGYDPKARTVKTADRTRSENVIFLRDRDFITARVQEAPTFTILGQQI